MKLRVARREPPDCGRAAPNRPASRLGIAIASILSTAIVTPAAQGLEADGEALLSEVVVTARKQTENLQDVPQSVTVFSSRDLDQLGISQFEDYATRSPSISYISIGPGSQQFFMRGVSDGSSPNVTNTSTTGFYLDELSLGYFGGIPDLHSYDIERIEVLSGPQGTLYGSGSMSGTVKLVTRKPDPTGFAAGIDLDGGKIDGGGRNGTVEGYLNLPLIEGTTALRVSGFYTKQGGFINNLLTTRHWVNGAVSDNSAWAGRNYNHDATYGGRVALLHEFNEHWRVTLSQDFQNESIHGAWDQNPSVNGVRNVARFGPEGGQRINRITSLTLQGDVGIADLIYAGGYWSRDNHSFNEYSEYVQYVSTPTVSAATVQGFACDTSTPNFSGCGVPTLYTDYRDHAERWSHEVRLHSKPGGSTDWTAGLYYEQTKDKYSDFYHYPNIKFGGHQASHYLDYYGGSPLPEEWYSYISRGDNHQFAFFGDVTQKLSDQWSLEAGVRDVKSNDSTSSVYAGYFYNPKTPTPTQSVSFSKVTYKAAIDFKYSENALYYLSFAQGFRDGGFNSRSNSTNLIPPSYKPDTLNNYELGWKTTWLGSHLRWDGAAYYMPWKDYQTSVFDLNISPSSFNANIGKARIYGVESNVEYTPVRGLTLSASVSYSDSRITDNSYVNPKFQVAAGERLPFVPYFKGSAVVRYEWPVANNLEAYGQYDISHTGDSWSDLRADVRQLQGAYNLSGLRFGVNETAAGWSAEAYITNLTNTRGVVYINVYNYDGRQTITEPRVFGLRLKYRYGKH